MQVLFVHGLGASPLSGLPMLWRLERQGHRARAFSYFSSLQGLAAVRGRLAARIARLAAEGDYALVGHSLGGVLIRGALQELPAGTPPPRHLFLLGSPVLPTRANRRLRGCFLYPLLAGECGRLVASSARMQAIGLPPVPTTCIVGRSPFGPGSSDGIVAESELGPERFADLVRVPASHPFLPASRAVSDLVLARLAGYDGSS